MRDDLSVPPELVLWVLLRQTGYLLGKVRERELGPYGLSPTAAAALFVIQAIPGPATPAEVSRWLLREPHSVSGLLDRMQKQGLVQKTQDLERRNLVRVSLTEKGRQAYELSTRREVVHRVLSVLSEEQREQLASLLRLLLNQALKELRIERPPFPP